MIISIASSKGGVGKTVTAMTLAAYFNTLAPTLLLDGDKTRNATTWAKRGGEAFPFRVAPAEHGVKLSRDFEYVVIDTGQGPDNDDLETAATSADILIIPAVPGGSDEDGLALTVEVLQKLQAAHTLRNLPPIDFRVLLTKVAPDAAREAGDLRRDLEEMGVVVFATQIPRLKVFGTAATQGKIVNAVPHNKTATRAWDYYVAVGKEILA